jgi:threonine synthase
MQLTGRTPLFRAKKIEAILGVKEIYLKLEGANPWGHKFDRISEIMIRDAESQGYNRMITDGPRNYLRSVTEAAKAKNIQVLLPIFRGQTWKMKLDYGAEFLDLRKTDPSHREGSYEKLCEENNFYNGAAGYHNTHLSIAALEQIGEELIDKIPSIDTVFTQLSYGFTVSSLYNSFFKAWASTKIEAYPHLYSCTIPKGNRIYEDYKKRNEIPDIEDYNIRPSKYSKDLYIDNTTLLEDALGAIRDTGGEILTIDEELLKEAANILRKHESIKLSTEEAYSFAGLYKAAKQGRLKDGCHIVILNEGKSNFKVERISDFSQLDEDQIYDLANSFLARYADPEHEMRDAIRNAIVKGAIFLVRMNDEIQGLTVVVHTGFEDFIPSYHLAYIGTHSGRKGRGIASELIEQVINFTQGNVSLHVDLDNTRAKKLYEKLGFKHCYNRMIYKGP